MSGSNLTAVQSQALSAIAVGETIVNLLSPSGATSAAVGDILAAASDLAALFDTSNPTLANFVTPTNDPIGAAYSSGAPYGGTFITAATTTNIVPINFDQSLTATTQALAQLSPAQQTALSAQTGVTLNTDADLSIALAAVFNQSQSNLQLAFSISLTDDSAITPVVPTVASGVISPNYAIPALTAAPNLTSLGSFVSKIAASFPNTPGIAGVAASIWVDGLGLAVNVFGATTVGVPPTIPSGVYSDITTAASQITTTPPIAITDYSYQQNQLNLLTALAIDNGLTTTLTNLLATSLATPASLQVVKNRLASVAQRGDAAMLSTMFATLGASNIPNAEQLLMTLLANFQPSDAASPAPTTPNFTASGITITTTSNTLTAAQLIGYTNEMLTLLGMTIETLCSQNTCNSVFCSQSLLNVSFLRSINLGIIEALLDPITVQMALMF